MELVEAFVQFSADTKKFDTAVGRVKDDLDGLKGNFQALQGIAEKAFLALAGYGIIAAKAFGDAEAEEVKLRSALRDSLEQTILNENAIRGYGNALNAIQSKNVEAVLDSTMEKLGGFASAMQQLTVYDDDAINGVMALALNLGVANKNLEQVTRTGIGLAQKFFGGDLKAGVEAAAKAYSGNTRALDRIIPGLKQAGTAQEKWNRIQVQGAAGFQQAEARTRSFNGAMLQLWGQLGNVTEQIGSVLAPALVEVASYVNALAQRFQGLSDVQTAQVVKWAAVAAGVAAFIAFGPKIISFAASVTSAMVSMAKVAGTAIAFLVRQVATGFIFLVTTPIGLLLGGLAALATGFAYLIGSGDGFVNKTLDGFMKIVSFMDTMLGSWQGFTASLATVWNQGGWLIAGVWENIQAYLLNQWEALKFAFKMVFYSFTSTVGEWATKIMGVFRSVIEYVKTAWENMINYLAGKMASLFVKRQAEADIRGKFTAGDTVDDKTVQRLQISGGLSKGEAEALKGKQLAEEDITKMVERESAKRMAELDKNAAREKALQEKAYADKQRGIQAETDATVGAIQDWGRKGTEAAANELVGNERKNNGNRDNNLGYIKQASKASLEADLAELAKMPKLSDKVKQAYDMIKQGMGLDGVQNFIDGIKGEVDKVRGDAAKAKQDALAQYGTGQATGTGQYAPVGNGQSIESAFKENLTKTLMGAVAINRGEDDRRKREADEKKKQHDDSLKAQRDAAAAAREAAAAQRDNTAALKANQGGSSGVGVMVD